MRRLALLAVVATMATGCQMLPLLDRGGVPLSVSGTGTFDCGSGFHGCTAWLAIRPTGWTRPAQWAPGQDDRDFRPNPSADDMSVWLVSGPGVGGPERLAPGDYRFMAVITETDDTKPWVLGTDDRPGSGVLNLTLACDEAVSVPEGATGLTVAVDFGPDCSIEAVADTP